MAATLNDGHASRWWCAIAAALVSCGLAFADPNEPASAFLAKHCQGCHAGNKPKGDFRLDSLSPDFSNKTNREKWLTVLERLGSGEMPPKEKPRPPAEDVKVVTDWINGQVTRSGVAEGRVGLRRLNRAEYENTIRDLLGVEMD